MAEVLACWRCGESLATVPLPFSRRAECPHCHAELHVCRMCMFFNPRISEKCDQPQAEHPRELDRANFCDYFKPSATAFVAVDKNKNRATKDRLEALFGGDQQADAASTDDAHNKLDQLFKTESEKTGGKNKEDK